MGSECSTAARAHVVSMRAFVVVAGSTYDLFQDCCGVPSLNAVINDYEKVYANEVNPPLLEWWTEYYEWVLPPPCRLVIRLSTEGGFMNHQPRAPPGEPP